MGTVSFQIIVESKPEGSKSPRLSAAAAPGMGASVVGLVYPGLAHL